MKLDDIEQKSPNQPNFGLVVALFCAALLVFFAVTVFFLHGRRNHLHFHHRANPNAQLALPGPSAA